MLPLATASIWALLAVVICPEVIDLLKDRSIDRAVFTALRKMKAMRQIDAVELMMAINNFTSRYAQALLAATRQEDLARPEQPKTVRGLTPEQMARMEREMEGLQREFKAVEASYGDSVLNLVVASGYLTKMIGNKQLSGYLERHYPEILLEFQAIVAASHSTTPDRSRWRCSSRRVHLFPAMECGRPAAIAKVKPATRRTTEKRLPCAPAQAKEHLSCINYA
jgi:hypothetical protein